jgi:hypothetical protein
MNKNLSQQKQVGQVPQDLSKNSNKNSGPSGVSVRLRPAITITGLLLLVGGGVSVLSTGLSLLSAIAIFFGLVVLVVNRFLRGPSGPLLTAADQIESQREAKLKELKRYISKTQYLENVGDLGETAAAQLTQISERFKKFGDLLALKFNPNEITYTRYFSAAEQTFLSILDNLHEVATSLNNIDAIDPDYTEDQLKLHSKDNSALEERKVLREKQISVVTELFAFNEKAITEFDRVSTALAEVKTQQGQSDVGLEVAMAELTELANRAKKYSIST